MSATIIAFPRSQRDLPAPPKAMVASTLATKFTDHFLPVVQASVDLLDADEGDFEARCRQMQDADGGRLFDELCREFELVGRQMRLLADGLELTRARLRTANARLALSNVSDSMS